METAIQIEPDLVENLMRCNPCYWAIKNKIRLMGGTVFTLNGCEYLEDIMLDSARRIVVMKGAQARITTLFMLRAIHALIYGKYPQGSLYYFPNKTAVESFGKTRWNPLIADNLCIKRFLLSTDSVNIKRVGKSFLRLLGATATVDIQGKKDSMAVRTEPGDEAIRDEIDLFDEAIAGMIPDRLLNSELKLEVDLGTPTIPDVGVDKIFGESDQKFRMIKCRACNEYTCIAEEFPGSIKYERQTTHEKYAPYFACIKCGKRIFVDDGEYVAKFPDRYSSEYPKDGISGYHVSHFITPNCDLDLVMKKYEKAESDRSKMGMFYNSILGFAYIPLEDRLLRQNVFDCCGNDIMKSSSITATAMGADIMKTNRVVIAEKKGNEKAKIIYMARVSGFDALYDLTVKFNVKSAVICLRPYEESFRKFQVRCHGKVKVFGSEYRDKQRNLVKTDEQSGIYVVSRTEMMDKSHSWVISGALEIPRKCEEVNVFAKEVCNTAKVLETHDITGDRLYRYRPVGDKQDHYRHTLNYLLLALRNLHDYDLQPVFSGAEESDEWNPLTHDLF